ncbi:MAG TPA: hypothetical protein PLT64_03075 [Syntrophales bacterium]|nr:hypothetical protein [Syntrophales bacterium]HOL58836.1 hypothetical protein [Syntrophales bacterium]HPO35163.1 hypothetical protein [Syntrophales bacterium]
MSLQEEIGEIFAPFPCEFRERKGVVTVEWVLAERKTFLARKRLVYLAKYRVDEEAKEVRFTEMLKETGAGFSDSLGLSFKKEVYRTGKEGRSGTIEEQSRLLGSSYNYSHDFKAIREKVEEKTKAAGFSFTYQVLPFFS